MTILIIILFIIAISNTFAIAFLVKAQKFNREIDAIFEKRLSAIEATVKTQNEINDKLINHNRTQQVWNEKMIREIGKSFAILKQKR